MADAIPPTSPTACLDLRGTAHEIPDNLGGATIAISGDPTDLQTQLNAAINPDGTHKGNTLVVPPGYQAAPNLQFPVTKGPGYTCIRTAGSVTKGKRTTGGEPLFKTIGNGVINESRAFTIPAGADGYRIIGMEAMHPTDTFSYALAEVSGKRLSFESCDLHARPDQSNRRGIYLLEAEDVQIWDSRFTEFHEVGADSQTIFLRRTKRTHVDNCELQAAGENLLFGDQDSGSASVDGVVRRCHFYKPLGWRAAGAPAWTVKNLFELKFASRILVEGNIFENSWPMAQDGTAWLINCGMSEWGYAVVTQDVLFQDNTVIDAPYLLSISTVNSDRAVPARIALLHNLGLRIGGRLLLLNHAATDVWLEHNTVTAQRREGLPPGFGPQGAIFLAPDFDGAFPRFTLKRNVFGLGTYGIFVSGGRTDWDAIMPDRSWSENAEYDQPQSPAPGITAYPSPEAAGLNLDGTLLAASPLRAGNTGYLGTDAKNIGVDHDQLAAAQGGGTFPVPVPAPPPTPTPGGPMTTLSVKASDTIEVTVVDGPGNPADKIGLYRPTGITPAPGPVAMYRDATMWLYLNSRQSVIPSLGLKAATVVFGAVPPGTYEARLLQGDGFTVMAVSVSIMVPAPAAPPVPDPIPGPTPSTLEARVTVLEDQAAAGIAMDTELVARVRRLEDKAVKVKEALG